jgi:hypothetical protein
LQSETSVTPSRPSESSTAAVGRQLTVELDQFGWEMLERECARLGVSEHELARFSLMYYLADLDSGRVARNLPDGSGESSSGPTAI